MSNAPGNDQSGAFANVTELVSPQAPTEITGAFTPAAGSRPPSAAQVRQATHSGTGDPATAAAAALAAGLQAMGEDIGLLFAFTD